MPQFSLPSGGQHESSQSPPPHLTTSNPMYNYSYDFAEQQKLGSAGATTDAGGFDLTTSGLPFSGFDFLQNLGPGGAANGGFGAGDVALWQNFVQAGAFSDVPEHPFALLDGANGTGEAEQ